MATAALLHNLTRAAYLHLGTGADTGVTHAGAIGGHVNLIGLTGWFLGAVNGGLHRNICNDTLRRGSGVGRRDDIQNSRNGQEAHRNEGKLHAKPPKSKGCDKTDYWHTQVEEEL
jgi:hypothetical protein